MPIRATLTVLALTLTACSGGTGAGTPAPTATVTARPSPTATAAPTAITAPTPTAAATPERRDLDGDYDVGGRTLHLVCVGPSATGEPTVVFESGLDTPLGTWAARCRRWRTATACARTTARAWGPASRRRRRPAPPPT